MAKYIINKNKQDSESGENHEIHNEDYCKRLPNYENRIDLGYFNNCKDAMDNAIKRFPKSSKEIDGCFWCCNDCHTQ